MPDGSYCTLQQWIWAISMGFFLSFGLSRNRCIQNHYLHTTHTYTHTHTYKNLSLQFFLVQTKWTCEPHIFFHLTTHTIKDCGKFSTVFSRLNFWYLSFPETFLVQDQKLNLFILCVCWSPLLLPAASCVEYANAEDVLEKVSWCWCLMLSLMIKTEEKDVGLLFLYIICSSVPVETVETLCNCGGLWCADWWWMKT